MVLEDDDQFDLDGIALRTYELYLQRGDVDGHAEDDWLQAGARDPLRSA